MHQIQLHTVIWHELVNEGIDATDDAAFLDGIRELAWPIAAYVSIVPNRAWPRC